MAFDFTKVADDIAKTEADFNETTTGGGEGRTPPPEGVARLRFTGYIEAGQHDKKGKYAGKTEDLALWTFELSGKKYEPREIEVDGKKLTIPYRITIRTNKSQNEKAAYSKLFKRMNHDGKASHPVQLLGQAFLGTVSHFKFTGGDGKEVVIANFRDDQGNLTVRPPFIESTDDEGEVVLKSIKVPEPTDPIRCFVWSADEKYLGEMWESIRVESDKQYLQDEIKRARNFVGSPIYEYLQSQGADLSVPEAEKPEGGDDGEEAPKPENKVNKPAPRNGKTKAAEDDPLADLD